MVDYQEQDTQNREEETTIRLDNTSVHGATLLSYSLRSMQTRQGLWCLVSGFEVFSQVGKIDGIHLGCGQSLVGGTDSPDVNSKADYHRIVMHYVYLNIPNCQRKADNYVAIYGFLRTMTLIACIYFDYFFYWQVFTLNIHAGVNWNAVLILLLMGILCNVLFMGFIKFYRRFTLENYMALLTEKTTPQ